MSFQTKLVDVPGLGERSAKGLASSGVETLEDLADADSSDVAEAAKIEGWRAATWIDEAESMIESSGVSDDISTQETAETPSEGRTSTRESAAQIGSTPAPGAAPDDEFERLWGKLTDTQKKFCQEYLFTATKSEAAEAVGVTPSCVYSWPDYVEEAASMLVDRRASGLSEGMSALSPAALDVLRRALDPNSDVSRVEAESAQYLIDQLEGKATQKSEVDVQGGIDIGEDDQEALDEALSHLGDEEDKNR